MQFLGAMGFLFAIIAWSEIAALKKRIAALEAAAQGRPPQ